MGGGRASAPAVSSAGSLCLRPVEPSWQEPGITRQGPGRLLPHLIGGAGSGCVLPARRARNVRPPREQAPRSESSGGARTGLGGRASDVRRPPEMQDSGPGALPAVPAGVGQIFTRPGPGTWAGAEAVGVA